MSDPLWPHGLLHARPPCPSPTPGVYSNSCPLSHWCHPTTSSTVVHFSSHLHSFPAPGSFPMSQLLTSGGQSIGVSASTSVLPMNIQDRFPLNRRRFKGMAPLTGGSSGSGDQWWDSGYFKSMSSLPLLGGLATWEKNARAAPGVLVSTWKERAVCSVRFLGSR